jgi:amino acid adenylation domain-containing protein
MICFVRTLTAVMEVHADRTAIQARGECLTYGELLAQARALAVRLVEYRQHAGDRIALACDGSVADYVGLLAIWLAGCAYVPLHPKAPAERNADIVTRSQAIAMLVAGRIEPIGVSDAAPFHDGAYLIFTSGTTGRPKGVPITGANLETYLASLDRLFDITPQDKVAHISELSFDLSVHELLLAWAHGAALCRIAPAAALLSARYVEEEGITVWVSVPSTISLARKAGTLDAGSMRGIRLAFFCGEALSRVTACHFAEAAPDARIFNLWGPTETTVSLTWFEVGHAQDLPDIVPIGVPYEGQQVALFGADDAPVAPGMPGELSVAGPQVTQGYWQDPQSNALRFVEYGGTRWYRTGDLAVWDERYGFCYRGRTDRQVKIKGHRIELQECESALRDAGGWELVCVLPWPRSADGTAEGLVAFVCADAVDARTARQALALRLPTYMLPDRIVSVPEFPFNANGKIDYRALEERCAR